jgi:hypothetical protein
MTDLKRGCDPIALLERRPVGRHIRRPSAVVIQIEGCSRRSRPDFINSHVELASADAVRPRLHGLETFVESAIVATMELDCRSFEPNDAVRRLLPYPRDPRSHWYDA